MSTYIFILQHKRQNSYQRYNCTLFYSNSIKIGINFLSSRVPGRVRVEKCRVEYGSTKIILSISDRIAVTKCFLFFFYRIFNILVICSQLRIHDFVHESYTRFLRLCNRVATRAELNFIRF